MFSNKNLKEIKAFFIKEDLYFLTTRNYFNRYYYSKKDSSVNIVKEESITKK